MVDIFDLSELSRHVYSVNKSYWHVGKQVWLFRNEGIGIDNLIERHLYLIDVGFDDVIVFIENGVHYYIDMIYYIGINQSLAKHLMETTDITMKEIFEFALL